MGRFTFGNVWASFVVLVKIIAKGVWVSLRGVFAVVRFLIVNPWTRWGGVTLGLVIWGMFATGAVDETAKRHTNLTLYEGFEFARCFVGLNGAARCAELKDIWTHGPTISAKDIDQDAAQAKLRQDMTDIARKAEDERQRTERGLAAVAASVEKLNRSLEKLSGDTDRKMADYRAEVRALSEAMADGNLAAAAIAEDRLERVQADIEFNVLRAENILTEIGRLETHLAEGTVPSLGAETAVNLGLYQPAAMHAPMPGTFEQAGARESPALAPTEPRPLAVAAVRPVHRTPEPSYGTGDQVGFAAPAQVVSFAADEGDMLAMQSWSVPPDYYEPPFVRSGRTHSEPVVIVNDDAPLELEPAEVDAFIAEVFESVGLADVTEPPAVSVDLQTLSVDLENRQAALSAALDQQRKVLADSRALSRNEFAEFQLLSNHKGYSMGRVDGRDGPNSKAGFRSLTLAHEGFSGLDTPNFADLETLRQMTPELGASEVQRRVEQHLAPPVVETRRVSPSVSDYGGQVWVNQGTEMPRSNGVIGNNGTVVVNQTGNGGVIYEQSDWSEWRDQTQILSDHSGMIQNMQDQMAQQRSALFDNSYSNYGGMFDNTGGLSSDWRSSLPDFTAPRTGFSGGTLPTLNN